MTKDDIKKGLNSSYSQLAAYCNSLIKDEIEYASVGKWSARLQMEQLVKSTSLLSKGTTLP